MKATALFVAILGICLLLIPMIALNYNAEPPAEMQTQVQVHNPALPEEALPLQEVMEPDDADSRENSQAEAEPSPLSDNGVESFLILDETTGEVHDVSVRDFVRGAVAAEMPAGFHTEALKSQAVAAHTFALRSHLEQMENPDPELKGADFSADPSNMKVYITEGTAREFYGDSANLYWNKICTAADSVLNYVLEYDDEPIVAAYHAISAGYTEDAANVWSGGAPYLQAVESRGDLLAPGYESSVTLTSDEVRAKLSAAYPDIELPEDASAWFSGILRSDSGYVTSIGAGDLTLHGKDIRTLFDLRSHNFTVGYENGAFTFAVTGYGHGIGLSQYGADFYARQGMSFDEILAVYYTGAVLKQINLTGEN